MCCVCEILFLLIYVHVCNECVLNVWTVIRVYILWRTHLRSHRHSTQWYIFVMLVSCLLLNLLLEYISLFVEVTLRTAKIKEFAFPQGSLLEICIKNCKPWVAYLLKCLQYGPGHLSKSHRWYTKSPGEACSTLVMLSSVLFSSITRQTDKLIPDAAICQRVWYINNW